MKLHFAVAMALIYAIASSAQAEVMTLQGTIKDGLEFSPDIKKSISSVEEAQALLRLRQGAIAPEIQLYGSAKLKKDSSQFSESTDRSEKEYDGGVQLVQPLYRGGALTPNLKVASTRIEIARQNVFLVRQNTISLLANRYLDLAQAESELEAIGQQTQVLKSYLATVQKYEANGRSRRMDRLQADVNLSLALADFEKLGRRRLNVMDQLNLLLGRSIDLEAVQTQGLDQIFSQKNKSPSGLDLGKNPELRVARLQREQLFEENKVEQAVDWPTLNLVASYGYRSTESSDWFEANSHYHAFGLNFVVPLFSGGTSFARRRIHLQRVVQEDQKIKAKELELRQQLRSAISSMEIEEKRFNTAKSAVRLGRESLAIANQAFKQGVGSNQDVLNAQRSRYESERLLIDAQFSFWRAQVEIARLQGMDLLSYFGL